MSIGYWLGDVRPNMGLINSIDMAALMIEEPKKTFVLDPIEVRKMLRKDVCHFRQCRLLIVGSGNEGRNRRRDPPPARISQAWSVRARKQKSPPPWNAYRKPRSLSRGRGKVSAPEPMPEKTMPVSTSAGLPLDYKARSRLYHVLSPGSHQFLKRHKRALGKLHSIWSDSWCSFKHIIRPCLGR